MVRILGFLDIFATALLLAIAFEATVPQGLIITIAALLFLKALPFITDIGSIFDIGVVTLLALSLFVTIPVMVLYIGAVVIGLKGVMSLFATS